MSRETVNNETELSPDTMERVTSALSETAACVAFLGIVGIAASILTVAFAAVAFLAGITDLHRGGIGPIVAGFAFGVAAMFLFYPAQKLLTYRKCINTFLQRPKPRELRLTIIEQAAFWRFASIALVAVTVACVLASFVSVPSS